MNRTYKKTTISYKKYISLKITMHNKTEWNRKIHLVKKTRLNKMLSIYYLSSFIISILDKACLRNFCLSFTLKYQNNGV